MSFTINPYPFSNFSAFTNPLIQWMNLNLDIWANKAPFLEQEDRKIATQEILKCYEEKTTSLCLSSLHLSSLPDCLTYCNHLEELDLSNNQLSVIPSLKGFSKLKVLDVSCNSLTHLPSLLDCQNLSQLYVYYNHLDQLPSFENCYVLSTLHAFGNALTVFPNIQKCIHLEMINLSGNRIEKLPDYLPTLSSQCIVWLESDPIPQKHLSAILNDISLQRARHRPTGPYLLDEIGNPMQNETSLEDILKWLIPTKTSSFTTSAECQQLLSLLDLPQKNSLALFFTKLSTSADYQNQDTKERMVYRIVFMLSGIYQNNCFRDVVFQILSDALSSCEDRAANAFDQIELQWHLHRKDLSLPAFRTIIVGAERISLLDEIAIQESRKSNGDQVSRLLYYRIALKKELALPISTSGMIFIANACVSDKRIEKVKKTVLEKTSSVEQVNAILLANDFWREKVQVEYIKIFDAIREQAYEELEQLSDGGLSDLDFLTRNNALKKQLETNIASKVKELTESRIWENPLQKRKIFTESGDF